MASTGATRWVEEHLGSGPVVKESFVGGSSWSSAYVYETAGGKKVFVKTALGRDEKMFKGEALGLQAMRATGAMCIPEVFHYGLLDSPGRGGSFIAMEYLNLGSCASQAELGTRLAQMHLAVPQDPMAASGHFGFPVDNTIGGTPQPNGWRDNWIDFYREQRLKHMLDLVGDGNLSRMGDKLCSNLEKLFEGAGEIRPCILHGDLWSGNIAGVNGQPTIFDPACYFGHHEAEFGMSWCAGFTREFYDAYHKLIPKAPGFEARSDLYQLYHILNHEVLFGGYYGQCASLLTRLTKNL